MINMDLLEIDELIGIRQDLSVVPINGISDICFLPFFYLRLHQKNVYHKIPTDKLKDLPDNIKKEVLQTLNFLIEKIN